MTSVGFITTPLSGGHAARGVGFYTSRLLAHLFPVAAKSDLKIIQIKAVDALSKGNLDLIHFPYFDLFTHTLPISRGVKTVVTIHDVIPLEYPHHYPPGIRGWLNLQAQRLALRSVDLVLTDSYASVKSVSKYLAVTHSKLRLVYLAADEKFRPIPNRQQLSQVRKKYNLPDKFVLYVGDVNWNKNLPGLVIACQKAQLPLVVVGKQAKEIESMDLSHPQLVHLVGVDWNLVLRLGFVPDADLVAIYNLATVYCQPSFAEGFGLSVLEALACGTAVACSQISPLTEIAGTAATYFDPYNTEAMAEALKAGKTGQELDQASRFSWQKTAQETILAYQEVLCR